ncbi:hypothetical protein TNCV_5029871 [Trichonephila clavipes]|nr:hypothetical protein TNCV_5029871 [Trichonephila clavipes]
MFVQTIEKRRKRYWSLYLMLRKGRCKIWITLDEALFHLPFPNDKTKIQYISPEKRRKEATVLQMQIGRQVLLYGWDCPLKA